MTMWGLRWLPRTFYGLVSLVGRQRISCAFSSPVFSYSCHVLYWSPHEIYPASTSRSAPINPIGNVLERGSPGSEFAGISQRAGIFPYYRLSLIHGQQVVDGSPPRPTGRTPTSHLSHPLPARSTTPTTFGNQGPGTEPAPEHLGTTLFPERNRGADVERSTSTVNCKCPEETRGD